MKDELLKTIKTKKVRDYTYAIMFFMVASFFALAVIRPVLGIAISIQRQGEDLKRINSLYEKNITKVLELQADIENIRSKRYLLDEAVPSQPQLSEVIADIQRAGQVSGVKIITVQIDPLQLKQDAGSLKQKKTKKTASQLAGEVPADARIVGAQLRVSTSFEGMGALMQALVQQRRIKRIDSIKMTLEKPTNNGDEQIVNLSLQLEIETYYLTASNSL